MKLLWRHLTPYLILFLIIETCLRVTLLMRGMWDAEVTPWEMIQIFLRGFWLDVATSVFVLIPIVLIYLFSPSRWWKKSTGAAHSILHFVLIFLLLFGFASEHIFWSEFHTRFNFIAVDYLIYTQEVIGNITESYPVGGIIAALAVLAGFFTWFFLLLQHTKNNFTALSLSSRIGTAFGYAFICMLFYTASNSEQAQIDDNAIATEVAANGVYNLFQAFWANELSYERFYAQHDKKEIEAHARFLFAEEDIAFEKEEGITRIVSPEGEELHKNVILVVMESMGANFMERFGNTENLTPNLDALSKEGLFFTKAYATGTRTVRGLEAITLSLPPTPGQSIIRRPENDNLFSLGFIFKDRGYSTKFLYGGYGYFDNMNSFFAGNGFDIIDRSVLSEEEIHFSNVWGVADDDMFARAIREADADYRKGKPFMQLIMTTSNHRPYTYPDGRIDIPSKTGRQGGVKYADYSIGKLVEWAKEKPWFKDTVFVFVADHTAGAAGKIELDPQKYHIPMIFYAPGFIAPQRYEKIMSQIDLAPILLGQLNFHYRTKFYGEDVLHDPDEIAHAFISNYQKMALVKEDRITVLEPKRIIKQYDMMHEEAPVAKEDLLLEEDAVTYYQSASWWRDIYHRENTTVKE